MLKICGTALIAGLFSAFAPQNLGPPIGTLAPDFELKDSSGKTYKLSEFRGKKNVILEFFRSGSW